MALDPSIILAGQAPNIIGAIDAGNIAGQRRNEFVRTNALNAFLQQNGPGVMAGDQNALAGLARFDPTAALGVQDTRQQMAARDQTMQALTAQEQRAVEEHGMRMTAAQREAEALQIQQGVSAGLAATSPQQWDAIVTQFGATDLVGQFDNREAIAQRYLSVADALKRLDEQNAGPAAVDPIDAIKLERERIALEQDQMALDAARNPAPAAVEPVDPAKLRDEWNKLPAVREFQGQSAAFSRVAASAMERTPAGDMALIFGVMKLLDPASTVREGEAAQASQAPGIEASILTQYNQAVRGQMLTEERRQELFNMAKSQYQAAESSIGRVRQQYEKTALNQGLNPDEVLTDYRFSTGARGAVPFTVNRPQARPGQAQSAPAGIVGTGGQLPALPAGALATPAPTAQEAMPTANTAPSPVTQGPDIPPPEPLMQSPTFAQIAAKRGMTPQELWASLPIDQKQALAGQ